VFSVTASAALIAAALEHRFRSVVLAQMVVPHCAAVRPCSSGVPDFWYGSP
jgi:hypothetical protein